MHTNNDDEISRAHNTNNDYTDSEAYNLLYGNNTEKIEKEDLLNELREDTKPSKAKIIIPSVVAILVIAIAVALLLSGKLSDLFIKDETTSYLPDNYSYSEQTYSTETSELFVKIVFDANGGTADFYERDGSIGDTYGTLPNATREGYEFLGWFTEKEGGEQISSYSIINESNPVLYAQWEEVTTTSVTTTVKVTTTSKTTTTTTTIRPAMEAGTNTPGPKRTNVVLAKTSDIVVYQPEGSSRLIFPENENYYRQEGAAIDSNNGGFSSIVYKEFWGDGGYSAAYFAELEAADYDNCSVYDKDINGLKFSCLDYYDQTLGYCTKLYYVSDGHLIIITGSSHSKEYLLSMFEACIMRA